MGPNAHGPTLLSPRHDTNSSGGERYIIFVSFKGKNTVPTLTTGGAKNKFKSYKNKMSSKECFKRPLKHKKVKNKSESLVKLFSKSTALKIVGLSLPHVTIFKKFKTVQVKPVAHIVRETLACQPEIIKVNSIDESKVKQVETDKVTGELFFSLNINGVLVKFLIDTGSPVSLMSHKQYKKCFPHNNIRKIKNKIKLSSYTGHAVSTNFSIEPLVDLPGYGELKQRFIITTNELGNIIGRDFLHQTEAQIILSRDPEQTYMTLEKNQIA